MEGDGMRITVGLVLSIVTLIGTLLVGGSNFGELRSATKVNARMIKENREHVDKVIVIIRKEDKDRETTFRKEAVEITWIIAQISADIEWVKEQLRREDKE
jgi:CO dehydrogenase nickel-insertion accessory protein CooC1